MEIGPKMVSRPSSAANGRLTVSWLRVRGMFLTKARRGRTWESLSVPLSQGHRRAARIRLLYDTRQHGSAETGAREASQRRQQLVLKALIVSPRGGLDAPLV